MRICATYGTAGRPRAWDGYREFRLDTFDTLPPTDERTIVTLCGRDPSSVPNDFRGLVDVGDMEVGTGHRTIVSHHDFDGTPSADAIVSLLSSSTAEIVKGAFRVDSLNDLMSILEASRRIGRRHLLFGMGESGTVTRLRPGILGNEFTFGYIDRPTAPGQLTVEELERLGDDCTIVGITGHPLDHTLSPVMHNAAMTAAGINGTYLRFESESIDRFDEVMVGYDIRGMNVTIPHKTSVMGCLDSVTDTAEAVGAVNTVTNTNGTLVGDNTDPEGIAFSFRHSVPDSGSKVLVMGSGGAARSAVHAMLGMGCEVTVVGRNPGTVADIARHFSVTGTSQARASDFEVIINCTPIGMEADGPYPADINTIGPDHVILDVVYNRTTGLMREGWANGSTVLDGKDVLVGQGAGSFRAWFGRDGDTGVMRRSLG